MDTTTDTTTDDPKPTLRDRILDAAADLFSRKGVEAVGVESFEDAAGITRTALLHHFRSRDELVVAIVKRRNERWRVWLQQAVERRSKTPRGRLLAVFYALDEWFDDPDFARLASLGSTVSAADQDTDLRRAAREHREWLRTYVRDLAIDAGVPYPERLSHTYLLLIEGAVATALSGAVAGPAQLARHTASVLLTEQDAYRVAAPGLLLDAAPALRPSGARRVVIGGSGAPTHGSPSPRASLAAAPQGASGVTGGASVLALVVAGNADPRPAVMGGPTRSGL